MFRCSPTMLGQSSSMSTAGWSIAAPPPAHVG
nr:MAG TPA: hypothetical protein [Caudoviricetes sp.]